MSPRILYLASGFNPEGPEVVGWSLVRHMSLGSDRSLRVGSLLSKETTVRLDFGGSSIETSLDDSVVAIDELQEWDVIYAEGGRLLAIDQLLMPEVLEWVHQGNQFVLADVSAGRARDKDSRPRFEQLSKRFGIGPIYKQDGMGRSPEQLSDPRLSALADARHQLLQFNLHSAPTGSVHYIEDPDSDHHARAVIHANQAVLEISEEWLKAPWREVESVIVGDPIEVVGGGLQAHLAGTVPTGVTMLDKQPVPTYGRAWAVVKEHGRGHIVLLGAAVSHDDLVDGNPDNARWINALIGAICDRSHLKVAKLGARLGGRGTVDGNEILAAEESGRLERKAGFSPMMGRNTDTGIDVFNVARAVAAMANADGGIVVIGQREDLELVEPLDLFAQLGSTNADGFERGLRGKVASCMDSGYRALTVRFEWLHRDGRRAMAITVPRSPDPIHLKTSKADREAHAVFVRQGNETRQLTGPVLAKWIAARGR